MLADTRDYLFSGQISRFVLLNIRLGIRLFCTPSSYEVESIITKRLLPALIGLMKSCCHCIYKKLTNPYQDIRNRLQKNYSRKHVLFLTLHSCLRKLFSAPKCDCALYWICCILSVFWPTTPSLVTTWPNLAHAFVQHTEKGAGSELSNSGLNLKQYQSYCDFLVSDMFLKGRPVLLSGFSFSKQ